MKLVQLNMWTGRLGRKVPDFLKKEDADIVCLQEAMEVPGGDDTVFYSIDKIQEAISAKNVYYSPTFYFGFMKRKAGFGNCILTKLPMLKAETIFTSGELNQDFDHKEHFSNIRNLQHVVIELKNGKKLNILNHHGYHIEGHKNGDDETLRMCTEIAEYVTKLNGSVILTGDFNLIPNSKSINVLDKVLVNLTKLNELKTTRSSLTHKTEACDYIFVSKDITVNSFYAAEEVVSDHQALVLEFDITD